MRRRRFRRKMPRIITMRNGNIVPDIMRTKLVYSEALVFPTMGPTPTAYILRGNDAFDPDFTGIGHQPLGWDQLAVFYKRYRVNACKISVTAAVNTSSTSHSPVLVAVHDSLSTTPAISISSVMERVRTKWRQLNANAGQTKTITQFLTTKKALGITQLTDHEEADMVSPTPNPVNKWYWHIFAGNVDPSDTSSITATIKLTYYVDLFERIPVSQS